MSNALGKVQDESINNCHLFATIELLLCMITKEVFEKRIDKKGWYSDLGIGDSTERSYVMPYRDGKLPTEKIEDILVKAGYKVKQEETWEI